MKWDDAYTWEMVRMAAEKSRMLANPGEVVETFDFTGQRIARP